MDFRQTPEQELLAAAVATLAGRYGHDYFQAKTRAGTKPDELWSELGRAGFLGVHLPEAYGGGGMGISELAIVCEEVAAQGCPLLLMLVSPAICATLIATHGTEEQRRRWLPPMARGEAKMAFAITEPDAGSNSHRISTTARRDGDVWRLNGTKYYISGVDEAEAVIVVTRTGTDEATGRASLSLFVVDTDSKGMEARTIPVEIAAPEKQFTLFFDDCVLEEDRLLGTEGDGLHQVFAGLNPERLMGAAISCGIGRYALERGGRLREAAHRLGPPDRRAPRHLPTRWPSPRSSWSSHASCSRRPPGATTPASSAGEAANMAKYAAAEASLRRLSTKQSRPTVATASPRSTASPTCGAPHGCCGRRR